MLGVGVGVAVGVGLGVGDGEGTGVGVGVGIGVGLGVGVGATTVITAGNDKTRRPFAVISAWPALIAFASPFASIVTTA